MRSTPPAGAGKLIVASFGSDEELVVASNDHYLGPKWSPDGSHLVSRGSRGLAIVEDDGENQAFVANTDARRIDDRDTQIFVMRPDGTDVRQLTHEVGWHGYPSWSPDGTMIAYAAQAFVDGDWRAPIHVMRADGTDRHHIGPYDSPAWAPDWSSATG